jgi:hypothetical protein
MTKQEAIDYIIECTSDNMEIQEMDNLIEFYLKQEYSDYSKEELLDVLHIYDEDATISEDWNQLRVNTNEDGVYIYKDGDEIVSWIWEEVNEDQEVINSIGNAIYLAYNNPEKLLNKLNIHRYFDVYIFDGKNSFSIPVKINNKDIDPEYEELSIAQYAHEKGLCDIDDLDYVGDVREIELDEYLQMKGISK